MQDPNELSLGNTTKEQLEDIMTRQVERLSIVHREFIHYVDVMARDVRDKIDNTEQARMAQQAIGQLTQQLNEGLNTQILDLLTLESALAIVRLAVLLGDQQTLFGQQAGVIHMLTNTLLSVRRAEDNKGRIILAPGSMSDN